MKQPPPGDRTHGAIATLGDLLYADKAKSRVSESEWIVLVESIASGDRFALRSLYERMHRLVFTLILRRTDDRESAEEVTLDVFHDVWRWASKYDPQCGTVVGWVMNQARSRANVWMRSEQRSRHVKPHHHASKLEIGGIKRDAPPASKEQGRRRLRPVVDAFGSLATDLLCPSEDLWGRLVQRIAVQGDQQIALTANLHRPESEWEQVAPGISCKLLATDSERQRVSMLVRLAPGVDYPPHRHAGVEELHLLFGELWIDDRKLSPGDYNRAEPGTADSRVWSETGCTCVLITSPLDELR
jgi:DNA-directed RNA polymerase specialized sigma24 family protein